MGAALTISARGRTDGQRFGVRPERLRSNEVSDDDPFAHLLSTVPRATRPCARGVQSWCAGGDSADNHTRAADILGCRAGPTGDPAHASVGSADRGASLTY